MDGHHARRAVALAVIAVAGCSSESHRPPADLVDGTPAEEPAIGVDASTPQILTNVALIRGKDAVAGTAAGECLRAARGHEATGPVVVRTGVSGVSVTFRTASGPALVACDASHAIRADAATWCGRAYGRLDGGRLLDPRLDLAGCRTATGDTIAFAWIVPLRATSYVAVRQSGYTEVYRVVGRLPVRVTTGAVAPDRSAATFEISEQSASGALLRSATVEARVAG